MIKKIIILVLILLVVGLYFKTELTKKIMGVTGKATMDLSKRAYEEIKESDELKEIKKEIVDNISEKINETLHKK